jgi:heme exporter protein D
MVQKELKEVLVIKDYQDFLVIGELEVILVWLGVMVSLVILVRQV